tara:strand:- start:7602 stop:9794 length:2193 start_codon:yes stop_codon:yes gene_type:complete
MVFSIWRFSHLTLAISSFVFILIASVTGIILAIEPISEQLKPYSAEGLENTSLASTIAILENEYNEVISIEKDYNDFIIVSVITETGTNERFYINPITGKKIGAIIEKAPIYKFATNLHRSLFLKTTGRIIIGIVSFLLLLIAITGLLLIIRRQGGITKLYSKVVKEDFYQYYHVILGRISLIPIIIITITGLYLSLDRFFLFTQKNISHQIKTIHFIEEQKIEHNQFQIFKNTSLKKLKILEFPFSKDEEDYFYLKLKDKETMIHQYNGDVLSSVKYPYVVLASSFSASLHTGRGSIVWSLILLLSTTSILFFIFSGFVMSLRRKRKTSKIPINIFNKKNAEYVILVGSETGNTFQLAMLFFDALKKLQKKVFITDLNNYTNFKNLKHLCILTSTYGQGVAPANSEKFLQQFNSIQLTQRVQFSVVGFGSLAYPDFCQFAIDLDNAITKKINFNQTIPLHKIHNQNFNDFLRWSVAWSNKTEIPIQLKEDKKPQKNVVTFKVIDKTALNEDKTFLIRLKTASETKYKAGDLLEIYPKQDTVVRYYSIGSINDDILLSIKKHSQGICSTYLSQLKKGSVVFGHIKKNKKFYFPNQCKEVILISNGTGIAPFLGMLNENKSQVRTHLFWGGRNKSSFSLYGDLITEAIQLKQLNSLSIAFSREQEEKKYVQQLIAESSEIVLRVLVQKGIIMICGSLAMESGVKEVLASITKSKMNLELNEFSNQIKSDCY